MSPSPSYMQLARGGGKLPAGVAEHNYGRGTLEIGKLLDRASKIV